MPFFILSYRNPKNIDGSDASALDIGFAAAGILLPIISGSSVKRLLSVADEYKGTKQGGITEVFDIVDDKITINGKAANTDVDFVITKEGELRMGTGHYHLSESADDVINAGRIGIENGKINYLDNGSGHYRPGNDKLIDAANTFKNNKLTSENLGIFSVSQ